MLKRNLSWVCCAAFVSAAFVSAVAFAQEKKDDGKPAAAKPAPATPAKPGDATKPGDKAMGGMDPKAMEEMMKVPAEAKNLEFMIGEWDTNVKFRMTADMPWQESKGMCTARWVMDGHHIQADHTGDMGGMPFKGMEIVTWDISKKKYISTWCDNMASMIMVSEGTFDGGKKTFTWTSEGICPMDNKNVKVRNIITIVDNNKHTMEWFETRDGKETKTMEIVAIRKGAVPAAGSVK